MRFCFRNNMRYLKIRGFIVNKLWIILTVFFQLKGVNGISQVRISKHTPITLTQKSDVFYSEFTTFYLSSDIEGEGVLLLTHVDSLETWGQPNIPNLVLEESTLKLKGQVMVQGQLLLFQTTLYIQDSTFLNQFPNRVLDPTSAIVWSRYKPLKERVTPKFNGMLLKPDILITKDIQTYNTWSFTQLHCREVRSYLNENLYRSRWRSVKSPPPKPLNQKQVFFISNRV